MTYETIVYEPGVVARIILNRPEQMNAQSRLLLRELDDAIAAACRDAEVRVIVVSGAGKHFSAGHDVKEMADPKLPAEDAQQRYERMRRVYTEDHLRWRNATKPTIAMVRGYCIWGGWMVASAMDLIFASEDALFLANPYPADYWTVTWDIGQRRTKEILFEHRVITAAEAKEMGFVSRVYSAEELEAQTLAYAARVAENDPAEVQALKYVVNQTMDAMGFSTSVVTAFNGTGVFRNRRAAYYASPETRPKNYRDNPFSNSVGRAMARYRAQLRDRKSSAQE